ncbi:hypothetical protein COEREDRAFT_16635 [Coemansia reversa NRRL 1564]|uniref:Uncharacterized protein n=1 Tax=Coemansia reversa (strain ATCC 12441 / NRRL 1564) TaxID=763665 RepID=A0A2G5B6Z6_COERN|nr:hypothetical protein COEREDRAFT_16635 [Coemansia reversa NRRL 1564]|eukprot:PIA14779.1 hypothetical protein COEREDRAFT_16635 [Coemansia reversa NRRL 1564]
MPTSGEARRQVHFLSARCPALIPAQLLDIVTSQERLEAEKARDRDALAYLQDVHLAVVLQRLKRSELRTFLRSTVFISDTGDICIVLHNLRLGEGWVGRARLESTASKQLLEMTACAEHHSSDSLFRYQPPTLYDEWTAELSLEFDPCYKVPAFVTTPVSTTCISRHHIDTLDAIAPCDRSSSHCAGSTEAIETDIPCLCEIWVRLPDSTTGSQANSSDLAAQARQLLSVLLFENLPPKARNNLAAIMISSYAAEFCILGGITQKSTPVFVMCVPERDHIALRIRSTCCLSYSAVIVALAGRLSLLLNANSGNDADKSTSGTCQQLNNLKAKHTEVVAKLLESPVQNSTAAPSTSSYCVDFVLIEGAGLDFCG